MNEDQNLTKEELIAELQTLRKKMSSNPIHPPEDASIAKNECKHISEAIFDCLTANIALLDENGVIKLVNKAWKDFAQENNAIFEQVVEGVNYLDVCNNSQGSDSEEAAEFAQGVRDVLAGDSVLYILEYPCHSPDKKRWFHVRVTPFVSSEQRGVVVVHEDITERKQMEDTLRENQSRLDLALESAMMGTWQWDIVEDKRYFDSRVCLHLGLNPANFRGTAEEFFGAVHPDDREILKEALAKTIDQGIPYESEYRAVWPDGSIHYVSTHGKMIHDDSGQPVKIIGLVEDITDKKSVQQQLKNERQRLLNIIQGTRAGLWEWNVQTGETVFNPIWAEIVGYTLEELTPICIKTWTSLVHPEDLQKSGELLEKHFSGELPYYDCQCRMRHKNGHWVWVHDRGKVIVWADDGKPLMMFGTHLDITESMLAHHSLQEAEERYRNFFASVEAVKLIIDPADGAIMDANVAAQEFYGYDLERLQSMFIYDLNQLPREKVLSELAKASKLEKGHFYFKHRVASGEIRDVEVHTSAIQHKSKRLLMSSIHDITEMRRLEQVKEDVQHILRHDLRAPVTASINLPLLLMEDENLTPDQRQMLQMINVSGRKMLSQINSSLELHKIENGTYILKPQECSPVKLVRDNIDILAVSMDITPDLFIIREHVDGTGKSGLTLQTDGLLLDIILMNLLRNALEASDLDAQVLVDLSEDGDELAIAIANGRPVPLEIRERFFDKYTTAGNKEGTGLGTYSAFIMTRALGGSIAMETSEISGTKVTVRFPIRSREV